MIDQSSAYTTRRSPAVETAKHKEHPHLSFSRNPYVVSCLSRYILDSVLTLQRLFFSYASRNCTVDIQMLTVRRLIP